MSSRLKKERGLGTTLRPTCHLSLGLQVERGLAGKNGEVKGGAADVFQQQGGRCCVCCGRFVNNDSLGGHAGRPLIGRLWCLSCCRG
jgi:hypothetical protein